MAQYHFVINGKDVGPYTLDEAKQLNITPDTFAWTEGMTDWAPAGTIPELTSVLTAQSQSNDIYIEQPNDHLGLAIFSVLMFPIGIAALVKAIMCKVRLSQGRYDDALYLSKSAKRYAITSIIVGAAIIILYIIYMAILIAAVG